MISYPQGLRSLPDPDFDDLYGDDAVSDEAFGTGLASETCERPELASADLFAGAVAANPVGCNCTNRRVVPNQRAPPDVQWDRAGGDTGNADARQMSGSDGPRADRAD